MNTSSNHFLGPYDSEPQDSLFILRLAEEEIELSLDDVIELGITKMKKAIKLPAVKIFFQISLNQEGKNN